MCAGGTIDEQVSDLKVVFANPLAISASDIDLSDERYRFSRGEASLELVESISGTGCLVPPICWPQECGRWLVVAGFRRLGVLSTCDVSQTVVVWPLPKETSDIDRFRIAIRDARRDGPIGPFAVSRILSRALQLGISRAEVARALCPELGLEAHQVVVDRHLRLTSIPERLSIFLEMSGVSLKRALRYSQLGQAEAQQLMELARVFGLSARAVEDWARMIGEIARRDQLGWEEVLLRAELWELTQQEIEQAHGWVSEARRRLWKLRYPSWHASREAARALVAELAFSERVKIDFDEEMEAEGFKLEISVRDLAELRTDLESIESSRRQQLLGELLEVL